MRAAQDGPFVLGLDGGTEGIRVGLFNAGGTPLAFAREAYPSTHDHPGWAEQWPDDWWDGAVRGVRRVLQETGVDPSAVVGLALGCTCYTMVCCDAAGTPLRPALMWMDVRSAVEAGRVAATGQPCLRWSGLSASAEWMPAKVLWLKGHESDIYRRTAWISDYVEWMSFRLTGERAASLNSAAIRCYYDRLTGGWPTALWDALGLADIEARMAGRVVAMGDVLGGLSRAAAEALGLRPGVPVAAGGADAFVGMVGLGVVDTGTVALITGSSHLHLLQSDEPQHAPGLFGAYTDAVIPGQYTVEGGQSSTGSVVNWFVRTLGSGASLIRLGEQAALVRPGAEGAMALDYWQGNRTPHVDADARGMFWGLTLHHRPEHMFRALLESVCFGTEAVLRTMRLAGHDVQDMVACGGALNSPTWMQIHADVSGTPIRIPEVADAVTLGAAILAATGAGLHRSVREASAAMVRTASVVEPRPALTEEYRPLVELYEEASRAMRPVMRRGAELARRHHARESAS